MNENNVLVAHFPRAAMGYAQGSVDEFVRQIGERLEEMQSRLDQLTDENESLKRHASSGHPSNENTSQREAALANAMLAIEQRKLSVDKEIDSITEQARREAESLKEAAKRETEGLREAAKRDTDSIRSSAQSEAAQIVVQARIAAEQMIEEAVSATTEEEARLQILCAQYDNTVAEIRRVLEMQLSLIPTSSGLGRGEVATQTVVTPNFSGPAFRDDDELTPSDIEALAQAA
jgi:cell division septum initiation protein DivIVA